MPSVEQLNQLNIKAANTGGRKYDSARHLPERTVPAAAPKAKVEQGGSGQSSNRGTM